MMTLIHSNCSTVKGASMPKNRVPSKHGRQCRHVDGELELEETLDVFVQRLCPSGPP